MKSFTRSLLTLCLAAGSLAARDASGQTYTVLHQLNGVSEGALPQYGITFDPNGNLYSAASLGGGNEYGTIFESDPAGAIKVLHTFDRTDGGVPEFGAMALLGTTLYGTANYGDEPALCGVLFSLQTDGSGYAVMHNFEGLDGCMPRGALQYVAGHGLVGVTSEGGSNYNAPSHGQGVLFALDRFGKYRRLHNFGKASDGSGPNAVFVDGSGNVFGSAGAGGPSCEDNKSGCGVIFKYNLVTEQYSILYAFTGEQDGSGPTLGSIGPDGTLYGTTHEGAGVARYGTLFQLSASGNAYTLETLADFPESLRNPTTGPSLSPRGQLVGVAYGDSYGGLYIYNHGTRRLLQIFNSDATGLNPSAQPAIGPGGTIFGTAYEGGIAPCVISKSTQYPAGCGLLFSYTDNSN